MLNLRREASMRPELSKTRAVHLPHAGRSPTNAYVPLRERPSKELATRISKTSVRTALIPAEVLA